MGRQAYHIEISYYNCNDSRVGCLKFVSCIRLKKKVVIHLQVIQQATVIEVTAMKCMYRPILVVTKFYIRIIIIIYLA